LTIASFFAAVEFGIQPLFWHAADGTPLYAPFPLSVSIPAMVIPHALIASVVEALVTVLVVVYLQRANQPALEMVSKPRFAPETGVFARWRALWIGLAVLVVASPIGLLAPGTAWGEWGAEELSSLGLSFIPKGMEQLGGLWNAPLPDYDLPILGNANLAYILSAAVGILVTVLVVWLFSMVALSGKESARKVIPEK
jgi:cobalt/nickel transport system permease protein